MKIKKIIIACSFASASISAIAQQVSFVDIRPSINAVSTLGETFLSSVISPIDKRAWLGTGDPADISASASPAITISPMMAAAKLNMPPLRTKVQITVIASPSSAPGSVSTFNITGKQVSQSAGTFQDLPRYLHSLPGVVAKGDLDNASIVRGGNPFENLYVVDGIEVPNINHLALADGTGGLVSMIDTTLLSSTDLYTGIYKSGYESRMSSVLDMQTKNIESEFSKREIDLSFAGIGGSFARQMGPTSYVMLAGRQSFINLITPDIGLNGTPVFSNGLTKFVSNPNSQDHFWIESIAGKDSLNMVPDALDNWETNAYTTSYSGWRDTTGIVWQRTYASTAVGTLTLSNSQQSQHLSQYDQVNNNSLIFQQDNSDGVTQIKYDYLTAIGDQQTSHLNIGGDVHLNRINYNFDQPLPLLTPYSDSTTPVPAYSVSPNFSTIDRAAYADLEFRPKPRVKIISGLRAEQWGYAGTPANSATCCCDSSGLVMPTKTAYMPHASISVEANSNFIFKAGYAKYSQLPPYGILTGASGNSALTLINSNHIVAGFDMIVTNDLVISVEGYRKYYSGYPVSTQFPSLSLADTLPTLGEAFSVLPMTSAGNGLTQGLEVSARLNQTHHVFGQANLALSGSRFSGTDGVMRRSNYNYPVVANLTVGVVVKKYVITAKNTATSGLPYTPILPLESYQQDRPIFDLSQINTLRGPVYNRLDIAINRDFRIGDKTLNFHAGAVNILNRQNLYEYDWRPRCPGCGPIAEPQIGFMPDLGASYIF